MKLKRGVPAPNKTSGKPINKRVDEFHRPATRFEKFRSGIEGLPKSRLYLGLLIVTWLSLTALISVDSQTLESLGLEKRGYQVGDVADKDIYAPSPATYDDPVATEQARRQAADNAPDIYRESEKIPKQVQDEVQGTFERISAIRNSGAPADEKVARAKDAAPFQLTEDASHALIYLNKQDIDNSESYIKENLKNLYSANAVADEDVQQKPADVIPISEARARLSEAAGRDASGKVRDIVDSLSRGFVEPNYVINRKATEAVRHAAKKDVQPVQGSVQQGERIVSRGEVIDRVDLARLNAVGSIQSSNPWTVFLGVGIVVAAEMGVAWYFLERFGRRILRTKSVIRVVLAASLTVLFTFLARAFVLLHFNPYLIPLAGLSIIGTMLLGPRLMFLMVVVSSVNVGIIGGNDFLLASALLLSSGFAIYTVVRADSRADLLRAGMFVAVVTSVVMFAVSLVGGGDLKTALWQGLLGLGNGVLSLMLAMVLLPLLENAFNILTSMKLLELSDPGNPLLHKLLQGAPGTFSHSMQVGNLAENAAERIGANTLLARVGAYYHDIGKLEHPAYFVENQISQMNPHTALSPALSAKIIKRHVKDGLGIGRTWDLPEEILDIIAQHHGTTRIEYFYRKALENAVDGEAVRESDFRYSEGRPKTKEAGIVMIADSVEATVKSLAKPTPKRIEDIVKDTIAKKIEDGQFDECELTMHEIHVTGDAIRDGLIGFLGPRIEYPGATPAARAKPAKHPS